MPGGDEDSLYDDGIDNGILESLIIITLAGALVLLVYYRQNRQLAAHIREGGERRNRAERHLQDQGLFPEPGDPDFAQWVAGGVGH